MKNRACLSGLAAAVLCCRLAAAALPTGVDLSALDGWKIVVADDAIPSEQYAAQEFQHHVALSTGHTLPIVTSTERVDQHIFIGPGEIMRRSRVGFQVDDLGPEDLRIIVRDGNIAIAGGRPRGTLYGVYSSYNQF